MATKILWKQVTQSSEYSSVSHIVCTNSATRPVPPDGVGPTSLTQMRYARNAFEITAELRLADIAD